MEHTITVPQFTTATDARTFVLNSGVLDWEWGGAASWEGFSAWLWHHSDEDDLRREDWWCECLRRYLVSVGEDPADYSLGGPTVTVTGYLSRIGRKGGSTGRGQSKARTTAGVAGAVRQILARVRREASAEGAHYSAGCGAHPLPDGREVEVRLAHTSDGGALLGVREYRVTSGHDDGRWRRV